MLAHSLLKVDQESDMSFVQQYITLKHRIGFEKLEINMEFQYFLAHFLQKVCLHLKFMQNWSR